MAALRESFGLDKPLHVQFLIYLTKLLHGDFGYSFVSQKPVLELIGSCALPTVILMLPSSVIAIFAGIFLGVISAIKVRTKVDYLVILMSMFGYSIPVFWFALILILLFSLTFPIFPAMGMSTLRYTATGIYQIGDLLHHLVLPSIVLGTWSVAMYTRFLRASMLEVLSQDYIITARAKGLDNRTIYYKHALKNALLPTLTLIGLQLGWLFEGAVMTETVFAWPGMGRLAWTALVSRDYPLIMGIFIIISIIVIIATLLTDVMYAIIDPRIRYS